MTTRSAPRTATDQSSAVRPLDNPSWQQLFGHITGYPVERPNSFRVSAPGTGTVITVGSVGETYAVQGIHTEITAAEQFDLGAIGFQPTGSQVRLDRVVVRLSRAFGELDILVILGTPAAAGVAVAPPPVNETNNVDETLAIVTRSAGTPVQQSGIADLRRKSPSIDLPPLGAAPSYPSPATRAAVAATDGQLAYLSDTHVLTARRAGGYELVAVSSPTSPTTIMSTAAGAWPTARPVPAASPVIFLLHPAAPFTTTAPPWAVTALDFIAKAT